MNFENVNLSRSKIQNANLSNLHIEDAQIGGATFRNIGLPPKGHPNYDPDAGKQEPVTFTNCNLSEAIFSEADLSGVDIKNCNIKGLKIDGILIEELIKNESN